MVKQLKTHPLPSVDSQILYKRYQPLDGEEIKAVILAVAEKAGVPQSACQLLNTSDEIDKRYLCGKFHILVTQSEPFEQTPLIDAALETYYARTAFPEAVDLMYDIAACTQVSVRKSVIPTDSLPDNLKTFSGVENIAFCELEETLQAMEIARLITTIIVERSQPDAVLWAPSRFLLKPDAFSALSRASNFDDLYLLPNPFAQQDPETDERLIGMEGIGAQWLTGHRVKVLPCGLPPEYLAEIIVAFAKVTRKNDQMIDDGDVFGRNENEKIQVIYHDEDDDDLSTIELKVVHNPDYGIIRENASAIYEYHEGASKETGPQTMDSEGAGLDPNDPVDAAILERLQDMKDETPAPQTAEGPDEETLELEMSGLDLPEQSSAPAYADASETVPPSTAPDLRETIAEASVRFEDTGAARKPSPPTNRMSLAELREFAKQAQVSTTPPGNAGKAPGFLSKLFKRKADR